MRPVPLLLPALASVWILGCSHKETEIEIDAKRELTSKDEQVRLNATGWQRFRPGERHYDYEVPEGWKRRKSTSMRKLDFAIGAGGEGEVYLSETGGDLGQNVNRWRRQFGLEAISVGEVNSLPRVTALGAELALVEATGDYAAGMGQAPRKDYALIGVIGATQTGVITIKMVGPETLVKAERERFLEFCRKLNLGG